MGLGVTTTYTNDMNIIKDAAPVIDINSNRSLTMTETGMHLGPVGPIHLLGPVGPGPYWAHSFVGRCWAQALLGPFICWALSDPFIYLGPVGPI